MQIAKLTSTLGAEISGLDLSRPLDNQAADDLVQALHCHHVLVVRGQKLDDTDLERITGYIGPFGETPFIEAVPQHPNVIAVVKRADEKRTPNFGGNWHSDFSFQPEPPSATLLHARTLPPFGGDTLFCNMHIAYDRLSPGMKQLADSLNCVHSAIRPYGRNGIYANPKRAPGMKINAGADAETEWVHPMVRVHPDNGLKSLFINPVYTLRIQDMTSEESKPLLQTLYKLATEESNTCRVTWQPDTLTIWDNRSVMHYAVNDYEGYDRILHRTTAAGEAPIAGTA